MVPMTAKATGVNISITAVTGVYTYHYTSSQRKVDAINVDEGGFSSVALNVCAVALNAVFMMKVWMKVVDVFCNCS